MEGKNSSAAYLVLAVLAGVLLVLNLGIGSVNIPLREVLSVLAGKDGGVSRDIILDIRFPRALAAAVLGGALALSGYLLQTFFHNPVAGPFILGISSGAKLLVASVLVISMKQMLQPGSAVMVGAAFIGAMASMGVVLLMSQMVESMSMLVISGVMVGYICSAVTDFLVAFAEDADIVNLHNWSKGSFSGIGWGDVAMMAVVVMAASLCVLLLSKQIAAYQLGEAYARSLGMDVMGFRLLLVLLSSVLSACVTAFAGPVSFVGIAVPHLMKRLLGTSRPFLVIPACFLGGAAFCLFCDLLARTLLAPAELGISTVTAVFGAPVVILILVRQKRGRIR